MNISADTYQPSIQSLSYQIRAIPVRRKSVNESSEQAAQIDQLHVSPRAREIQQAGQIVGQPFEEIREKKIVALRRDIASGQYQTQAEQIAEKLVKDHLLNLLD